METELTPFINNTVVKYEIVGDNEYDTKEELKYEYAKNVDLDDTEMKKLYEDHVIKDEYGLVIGPVVIQMPSLTLKQLSISTRDQIIFEADNEENNKQNISNLKIHTKGHNVKQTPSKKNLVSPSGKTPDRDAGKRFLCHICKKKMTLQTNLDRHLREIHEKSKYYSVCYQCDVCGKQFKRKDNFMSHKNIHFDAKAFSCNSCQKQFNHRSNFNRHLRIYCVKEDKKLEGDEYIQRREKRKQENKFICDICKNVLYFKIDLIRHINGHYNIKPFKCELCTEKYFSRKSNLRNHIQAQHDRMKKIECRKCDKKYLRKYSLHLHIKKHHSS